MYIFIKVQRKIHKLRIKVQRKVQKKNLLMIKMNLLKTENKKLNNLIVLILIIHRSNQRIKVLI